MTRLLLFYQPHGGFYSKRKELTTVKTQNPKYDQESKERAKLARELADLLWRKACQTMTQDEQELLLQCMSIGEMVAVVIPEEQEKVDYDFERIAQMVDRAEDLLIGAPKTESPRGLKWDCLQVSPKEHEVGSA